MATSVTLNGTSYSIPSEGDSNWGTNTSNYLIAISTAVLQKTGGTFTLTSEIDFGATYGIKSAYFKSRATNPSSTGVIRLGNNEGVSWRNAANTSDLILKLNASDDLEYVGSVHFGDAGTEGAGINIGGTTYNSTFKVSDINGTNYAQTILHRHSTTLEPLIVGARSNSNTSAHTDVTSSQNLFTIYSAGYAGSNYKLFSQIAMGASASGTISNTSAPGMIRFYTTPDTSVTPGLALKLDQDKSAIFYGVVNLDAITASRVLVSGTGKNIEASSITTTTLAFLDATSSIQTQLDAKVPKTLTTTTGDMIYASSANTPARLAIGSSGQVLKTVAGVPTWATFSGGINYLSSNPDAEGGTTGWATYADAAGSSPVDGTGGSPSATWTQSSSSPLRGTYSFLLTKDAVNRQGNGVSFDFSIDSADKTKVIRGYFDYAIASGTYADDDVTVWIYDVTNATLIQPAPYKIKNHSLSSDRMNFEFQASTSTSYRLILHIGSISFLAYTLKCDNFVVGPIEKVYGSPVSDWQSYTPTIASGAGTISATITGKYRRLGDSLQIQVQYSYTSGTGAAAQFELSLPSGITPDSSKMNTNGHIGSGWFYTTATGFKNTDTRINGSNIYFTKDSVAGFLQGTDADDAGAGVIIQAVIPVTGWSSSQIMSSDADTRVVAARVTRNTTQAIATGTATKVQYNNISIDTHGAFDNVTNYRYTIQSSGVYRISSYLRWNTSVSAASDTQLLLYVNGSNSVQLSRQVGTANMGMSGSSLLRLTAGDYLEIYCYQNTGSSIDLEANTTYLNIEKLSGPAQIAASETIAFEAYSTSGAAIGTSLTDLVYGTEISDTHGAYNAATGVFTAPISGRYTFTWSVSTAAVNLSTAERFTSTLYSSAAATDIAYSSKANGNGVSISQTVVGSTTLRMLAGDTVKVRSVSSVATTEVTTAYANRFTGIRTGNY